MAAFAPQWPEPREERWFFFVADPGTNEVISPVEHVSLVEAEFLGADVAQVQGFKGTRNPLHKAWVMLRVQDVFAAISAPRARLLCLRTAIDV